MYIYYSPANIHSVTLNLLRTPATFYRSPRFLIRPNELLLHVILLQAVVWAAENNYWQICNNQIMSQYQQILHRETHCNNAFGGISSLSLTPNQLYNISVKVEFWALILCCVKYESFVDVIRLLSMLCMTEFKRSYIWRVIPLQARKFSSTSVVRGKLVKVCIWCNFALA